MTNSKHEDRAITQLTRHGPRGAEDVMALDLEPDEIYSQAVKVVQRAERKLWPLRMKVSVLKAVRSLLDLWARPIDAQTPRVPHW